MASCTGKYVTGSGMAHNCCRPHEKVFNCRMYGTFNIDVEWSFRIHTQPISVKCGPKNYRFVIMTHKPTGEQRIGWAIRDDGSRQLRNRLEVLTKKLLPDSFREGEIAVELPTLWDVDKIRNWVVDKYWFQTFPFSPKKRADSQLVWDKINHINWSGYEVLDFGCHYGFFSFEASKAGAHVLGVDNNGVSVKMAKTIRDHIIQQDVLLRKEEFLPIVPHCFDVILYLSVHHQIDPSYSGLEATVSHLKKLTRGHLFIELIMPPMYPNPKGLTEREIDRIVDGEVLCQYKHNVRGTRKIYHWEVK